MPTGSRPAAATSARVTAVMTAIVSRPGLDAVRPVVLVLDEHAVQAADPVGGELGQRVRDDGRQPGRFGIARQRRQVDHADQRLRGGEALSEAGHAAWYAAAGMPDATPYDPIAAGERALADAPADACAPRARAVREASTSTRPTAPSRSRSPSTISRSTRASARSSRQRLRSRISAAGLLAASSQDERSQHQNRRIARERLARMIGEAHPAQHARAARPGRAAARVERRLDEKRQISGAQAGARGPPATTPNAGQLCACALDALSPERVDTARPGPPRRAIRQGGRGRCPRATSPRSRASDDDARRLKELGYDQELERSWSGFTNFAISFSIISILAGCFTTYGQAWNNGGPIAISLGLADHLRLHPDHRSLHVRDPVGLPDGGRHLLLGAAARRPRLGLVHRLVQPGRPRRRGRLGRLRRRALRARTRSACSTRATTRSA